MNALYRPGCIDYIPMFINNKNLPTIPYLFPFEKKYLGETYGQLIYQEQLMQIAQNVAGFSKAESDQLRKALQKVKTEDIALIAPKFKLGVVKKGYSEEDAESIWNLFFETTDDIITYLFNKSHAVCYTWLAYQSAYLKAHYPDEYMTTVIKYHAHDADKLKQLRREYRRINAQQKRDAIE